MLVMGDSVTQMSTGRLGGSMSNGRHLEDQIRWFICPFHQESHKYPVLQNCIATNISQIPSSPFSCLKFHGSRLVTCLHSSLHSSLHSFYDSDSPKHERTLRFSNMRNGHSGHFSRISKFCLRPKKHHVFNLLPTARARHPDWYQT